VEPVVAAPAIDHRVHGHGDFQRGMGIEEGHQRQESVVRDAEDTDVAVRLRDVLDEPVDGVVGVGGVIDRRWVARAVERAVHDVIALRAVLATDVLDGAYISAFDDGLNSVVVALQDRAEV